MNNTNELQHHGIPGMKWGVRRYQNKDGSLTPAGKKKAAKMKDEYTKLTGKRLIQKRTPKSAADKPKEKSIKEMSDAELQAKINRLRKEQELASLQPKKVSTVKPSKITKGKNFVKMVGKEVVAPAAKAAGKDVLQRWFTKKANDYLGLNENKDNYSEKLANLAKDYENRVKIDKGQKHFNEGKYATKEKTNYKTPIGTVDIDIKKKKKN